MTRPLFVESRNTPVSCVVYRPDPQGWSVPIYQAKSRSEAEGLLAFLKQDSWNEACYVGDPEPPGDWIMVQGENIVLGNGRGLNWQLKSACEASLRYGGKTIKVRDSSGSNNQEYLISQGRVLRSSDPDERHV